MSFSGSKFHSQNLDGDYQWKSPLPRNISQGFELLFSADFG
jgi:hypothetical protein